MERVKKMKRNQLIACLHRTICHIFLLVNLAYLTVKYFAYDTQVDLGFYTPVALIPPNLSLCFDLNTVLGGNEIRVFNHHSPRFLGKTSKAIFDKVPGVHQVVKRCTLRDPVCDQMIQEENSTKCRQLFTIKRYRMHCFICYLFHLNRRHNFSFNALAFSLNEPKLLYNVAVDGLLTKGHAVAPILHLDELADFDRIYMKELFPSKKENELYHLEYSLYEIERLPHPYTTRCGPEPQLRCLYSCFSSGYAKVGLTPNNAMVKESPEVAQLKVATNSGSRNETRFRLKVGENCRKMCPSEACSQKLVITNIFGPFMSKRHKLSFNVGSYKGPINLMEYSPKLSFADYFTQLLTLSGIWVGFSVASLITRQKRFDIISTYRTWTALKAKVRVYCTLKLIPRTRNQRKVNFTSRVDEGKRRKLGKCQRLISVAFKLVTLLIFTGQALNLCFIYAKYETILTYEQILNPEFAYRLPSTVICVDINDLYSSRAQASISEQNREDVLSRKNEWANLTLDKIFDRTIGDDILINCRVKSYEWMQHFKGNFQLKSGKECLKEEFTFYKYYSRWQMCYLFTPKNLPENLPVTLKQHNLVFGERNPSKLYSLILNPKIKHYGKIDLLVDFDKENASYSTNEFGTFSPNLADKRVVILTFRTISFEYLPPPFDTRCDSSYPKYRCLNQCRRFKLAPLKRIPYSNVVKGKWERRLLSFEDLKNSTVNELYLKIEDYCEKKCNIDACTGNYTVTYSHHAIDRNNFDVEVVTSLESRPRTHSRSVPCFELYDFLYQLFCLLAFWMGFSFVALNFIQSKSEKRFNEAAKVLYSKTTKLLLKLRFFSVKINHSKAIASENSLLMKRVICHSICVVGMCLHLVLPISDYFAYPTRLLTTISYEKPIAFKLSVCSEGQDLFERGILFGQDKQRTEKYLFDRNLDEIISEAKRLNHSMSACGYWGLSRDEDKTNEMKKVTDRVFFESNSSSICRGSFQTNIFLKQGYVCFEHKLRRKATWTVSQMLAPINSAKTAFSVSLNSTMISERFTVIAHQYADGVRPLHSSVWAPTVYTKAGDSRFIVSYSSFNAEMLLYPYSNKGFIPSQITYCLLQCTNGRLDQFNITRIAIGEKMPRNKLFSNSHQVNSWLRKLRDEIDRQCDRNCLDDDILRKAKLFYKVTTISEPLPNKRGAKGSTRFDLRRTDDPVVTMKFFAAIPIYDLIINIGSVISIWFGLSVISIPDLATEDDMEKLYIKTVDNLETANCILKRIATNRNLPRSQRIV